MKGRFTGYDKDNEFNQSLDWDSLLAHLTASSTSLIDQRFFNAIDHCSDPTSQLLDYYHLLALAAKASDKDSPKWFDATNGKNSEGFWKAMGTEINTLISMVSFSVMPQTKDMHAISSTWAFKIKRFPSGLVWKLKAWFCCHDDQQIEGINFFETFAPVVSWTSICLMLILSIILNLKSTQVDYTVAFFQAAIDTEVYITQPCS